MAAISPWEKKYTAWSWQWFDKLRLKYWYEKNKWFFTRPNPEYQGEYEHEIRE